MPQTEIEPVRLEQPPHRPWAEIDAWSDAGVFLDGIASRAQLFRVRKAEQRPAYFRVRLTGQVFRIVNKTTTLSIPPGHVRLVAGIVAAH